jgi:hypothetical protein
MTTEIAEARDTVIVLDGLICGCAIQDLRDINYLMARELQRARKPHAAANAKDDQCQTCPQACQIPLQAKRSRSLLASARQ